MTDHHHGRPSIGVDDRPAAATAEAARLRARLSARGAAAVCSRRRAPADPGVQVDTSGVLAVGPRTFTVVQVLSAMKTAQTCIGRTCRGADKDLVAGMRR
jgi:hypothetical protein